MRMLLAIVLAGCGCVAGAQVVDVPLPDALASVDATGEVGIVPVHARWKPICGSRAMTREEVLAGAVAHEAAMRSARERGRVVRVNRQDRDPFATRTGTLDVIFNIQLDFAPGGAIEAFELAEAIIESRWSDPVEVFLEVSWDELGQNVLGLASITRARIGYSSSRAALLSGMDLDDYVQPWLPTGGSIPVRFAWNSVAETNVTQIDWPVAAYKAGVGSISAEAGSLRMSLSSLWDTDPRDGVAPGTTSLVDVILHEFAHIQGFDSNADNPGATTITALDLYRFASVDRVGIGDTSPDSEFDFSTRAREVALGSGGTDLVVSVVGDDRVPMSDGSTYQASHLKQVSFNPAQASGVMQPVLAQGTTFAPGYFRENDQVLLDAIGWDRIAPIYPNLGACATDWTKDGWPDVTWSVRRRTVQQIVNGQSVQCVEDPGLVVTWQFFEGQFVGWSLRPHPTGASVVCPPQAGPAWTRVDVTGDFDGDCDADILWRGVDGTHILWRMQDGGLAGWSVLPAVDPLWRIVAAGDIDADGTSDILWRHDTTQELGVWYVRSSAIIAWQPLGTSRTSPWEVQGLGDLVGPAGADILWRNTSTGANEAQAILPPSGGNGLGATAVLPSVGGAWKIKATGDYNGDGTTDLFWFLPTTGEMGLWLMDGTTVGQWRPLPGLDASMWE